MEADLKLMEELKDQIEKGRHNFKKSPKDRITEPYVVTRLEGLEKIADRFCNKHENIICKYKKEDLKESAYVKNDVYNVGYETYISYKTELKTALSSMSTSTSTNRDSSFTSNGNKDSLVKLPKISIPVFWGNYAEWSSFRDLFISLVHNNSSLDDVQRLHYLKTQLKGEAEQLIKHIPITHDNYKKCWDLLQNRYNNKRFMSNCILKRLFAQRVMTGESAGGLKDLLDTTSDCMHELSNLGIKVDSWDVIVIYIISLKLDVETRKQWELHINNLCVDLPTFGQFKEFLEGRFRALEFLEPSKSKPKPTYQAKSLHVTSDISCPHCAENHKLFCCSKFAKEEVNVRQDIVRSLGLCYNCLGSNHTVKMCRVPTTCRICKRKHHTLLHSKTSLYTVAVATDAPETDQADESEPEPSCPTSEATDHIVNNFVAGHVHNQTLLATALIKVNAKSGNDQILRALLDQGSQASFISEAAVQLLRLDKVSAKSRISGLGGGQSGLISKSVVVVNIQSLQDPTFELQVKAHVLAKVTSVLPERKFVLPCWSDLNSIALADPHYNSPNKIDILLGAEVYASILKGGLIKHPTSSMIAQDTHLGWVLSGQVGDVNNTGSRNHNIILNMHVKLEDNELLKRFWELEAEPDWEQTNMLTPEEQECEKHFEATTTRDESGRYVVELPFRLGDRTIGSYGDTKRVAIKRLLSLEKRLATKPEQRKNYAKVLQEYMTLGHMEEVVGDSEKTGEKVWLPHHAILRPDKSTTQTRVVFNASDRSANGVSLNDTLMVGPTLQPELRHIIMRWRLHPICLTADIVKMYRQVKVAKRHVDFQRIVWRDDIDSEIKDYRLLRVTFGMSCTPYLAVKALQQVAIDEGHDFPLAADRIKTDFYMDDLMTGCQSEKEAIEVFKQINSLLNKGGFTLQKWASNKTELLKLLEEERGDERDMEIKENDVTKILGLTWNRRNDEFSYTVNWSSESLPETKRQIIAEICRLYDPLGWLAPCIITAKVFIQKLWLTGLD